MIIDALRTWDDRTTGTCFVSRRSGCAAGVQRVCSGCAAGVAQWVREIRPAAEVEGTRSIPNACHQNPNSGLRKVVWGRGHRGAVHCHPRGTGTRYCGGGRPRSWLGQCCTGGSRGKGGMGASGEGAGLGRRVGEGVGLALARPPSPLPPPGKGRRGQRQPRTLLDHVFAALEDPPHPWPPFTAGEVRRTAASDRGGPLGTRGRELCKDLPQTPKAGSHRDPL